MAENSGKAGIVRAWLRETLAEHIRDVRAGRWMYEELLARGRPTDVVVIRVAGKGYAQFKQTPMPPAPEVELFSRAAGHVRVRAGSEVYELEGDDLALALLYKIATTLPDWARGATRDRSVVAQRAEALIGGGNRFVARLKSVAIAPEADPVATAVPDPKKAAEISGRVIAVGEVRDKWPLYTG